MGGMQFWSLPPITAIPAELKYHYDQILDPYFFYIFVRNRSFLDILPNFNLLQTLKLMFFGPLFPRIYGRHYFSLFQILVENWRK